MPRPPGGGHDDTGLNLKYAYHDCFGLGGQGLSGAGASLGVGGQVAAEIAAAGLTGIAMADDDTVYDTLNPNLSDIDLAQDIQARVIFLSTSADADAGTVFKLDCRGFAIGDVLASADATPDGSATFAAITMSGANKITATEWVSLSVGNELTADVLIALMLTLQVWAGTADEIVVLGVQLRGHRKITNDTGRQST